MSQPRQALKLGDARRMRQAEIRKQLKSGDLTIADVLTPVDESIAKKAAIDVISWQGRFGRRSVIMLNARAVRDGINLMRTCGELTDKSKQWIINNAKGVAK